MITAADIQTEMEKTERGLALLRVEVNQSEARLTALRTLLATMPPVAVVQPDPEPCMEAPTVAPALDQFEGEPETLPESAPTTPDQSEVGQIRTLFSQDPSVPDPGWRWLPHVQHLEYQDSRIRTVLDKLKLDLSLVWSPMSVAGKMGMTQDQASHALSDLYKHGLVMRRKVGRSHLYRALVTDDPPTAT